MYKYILFEYKNLFNADDIKYLENKFNTPNKKYYFKSGKYKGKDVTFILNDLETKEYSEPIESKKYKGCLYFPPKVPLVLEKFENFRNERKDKILVKLQNNEELYIIPASMEPKAIVFDFDDSEINTENNPYSQATEYGRLAYELFDATNNKKEQMKLNDPRIKKLILMSIQKSYSFSLDYINFINLISEKDLDPLLFAAMGISENDEQMNKKKDGCVE